MPIPSSTAAVPVASSILRRVRPGWSRALVFVVCIPLALGACAAPPPDTVPALAAVRGGPPLWPDRQPVAVWPQPAPLPPAAGPERTAFAPLQVRPSFLAPGAGSCARPIHTREVPGRVGGQQDAKPHERLRKELREGPADRPVLPRSVAAADDAAEASALAPAPSGSTRAAVDAPAAAMQPAPGAYRSQPVPRPAQQQPLAPDPVTAGVVDDNADFREYLAFRERTRVPHRPRDVRERYLLQVKNAQGHGVPDAEVLVRSPQGHAGWARTDAAGKVWLHPDAFDPQRAAAYEVTVRTGGEQASGYLQRGRKSALELRLQSAAVPARARLDLVFLIDATGSMADEIDKLKASLQSIARDVAALPSRPDLCFALVAYRDRGDAFLLRSHDFTNDLRAFQGVLDRLQAAGGGDYPEALDEALHETVHGLSWRDDGATRMVLLLADAPPHLGRDGPGYDESMVAALGKGIRIFSVGASGLDRQGEFVQRQIAQFTGGRFVFLTYARAGRSASGPGRETVHDVHNYSVDTLDALIVRLVREELAPLAAARAGL